MPDQSPDDISGLDLRSLSGAGEEASLPDIPSSGEEDLPELKARYYSDRIKELKEIHTLRSSHAKNLFIVAVWWMAGIIGALTLQGFSIFGFALSDAIMITYITTTTASIIGLYAIAAHWLFGKPRENGKSDKS